MLAEDMEKITIKSEKDNLSTAKNGISDILNVMEIYATMGLSECSVAVDVREMSKTVNELHKLGYRVYDFINEYNLGQLIIRWD
jgi:hypothetical protein